MKNIFITNYQRLLRAKTFVDTTDNLHYINSASLSIKNEAYTRFISADIVRALSKTKPTYAKPFTMYCEGYKIS